MKKNMLSITAWAMSLALTACSDLVKDRPDKVGIVPGNSFESARITNATLSDSITPGKAELTEIYTRAIADYIKAVYKKDKTVFDTLFLGKRAYGQPDDFPDIELPETIENTGIRLVSPEAGTKMMKERKSLVYINMIGWVDPKKAEFVLVTFLNGGEHKSDVYIDYTFNDRTKVFELSKSRIEQLIFNNEGKPDHFAVYEDGKYVGDKPIK